MYLNTGQQLRVMSHILYTITRIDDFYIYVIPSRKRILGTLSHMETTDKYDGAHVVKPNTGFHTGITTTLDFAGKLL